MARLRHVANRRRAPGHRRSADSGRGACEVAVAAAMEAGALRTGAVVAAWFVLNIAMGNLNGWILKHHGFAYPAALTVVHMLCGWALSAPSLLTILRPAEPRPASKATVAKVRTLALAFCASVAAGNIALRFIYVSFAQACASALHLGAHAHTARTHRRRHGASAPRRTARTHRPSRHPLRPRRWSPPRRLFSRCCSCARCRLRPTAAPRTSR